MSSAKCVAASHRPDLRDVQKHILIALAPSRSFHVPRAAAFDLDTAAGFLLDMLDIGSSMSYNLGAEIEARHRLNANRDFLLGPFALSTVRREGRRLQNLVPTLPNSSRSTGCCS